MLDLELYSRRGCHLCEQMLEELIPLCRDRATLRVLDVDDRPEWRTRYGLRVPVLCRGETELAVTRLDPQALAAVRATLSS
jgi:hypothetical protein